MFEEIEIEIRRFVVTEFVKLCDEFNIKVNFQCENVKNHRLNISVFFHNFYQNAVGMVKNLPSSIISSILDLGDDGGVSSLAIFC